MLLFPFSLVYGAAVWVRNRLYDKNIIGSSSFNLPLVCVGNLSVGGTGKSPMVEFIVSNLKEQTKLAVISRGYKRKTKGYALAGEDSTALDIGDEPLLLYKKNPDIAVAVGEERIVAIPQLLHDRPGIEAIILDDAFQHRSVTAGMNILLTDFNNLYSRDWFLPTGDLRDEKSSYKRAKLIVVTKCPPDFSIVDAREIEKELHPEKYQTIFFTTIEYGQPYHLVTNNVSELTEDMEVLLVTGIANPAPLKKYLSEHVKSYNEMVYPDHHIFSIDDLKDITRRFNAIQSDNKIILTTEKDAVRLWKFSAELQHVPVFAIPIAVRFLYNGKEPFLKMIRNFIQQFQTNTTYNGQERNEAEK